MAKEGYSANGGNAKAGNSIGTKRRYEKPETIVRGRTEEGYSHKMAKAVLEAEAADRKKGWENATIIDSNGNTVFHKVGKKDRVSFTYGEMARMKDAILTHNHPNEVKTRWWGAVGSPFSMADIMMAVNADLAEIRAVTPTYTFSLKRPKGGWGSSPEVQSRYKALQSKYLGEQIAYMRGGKDSKTSFERYDRSQLAKGHQIARDLAKEFGWRYTKKKG